MGNSKSNYERHKDDDEQQQQQQRIIIEKEFYLVLGQLDLPKEKKISFNKKQLHRKLSSSSSSNSTITSSSSSDQQYPFVSLIQFDIPTSLFDSNEFNTQTLIQYLIHQQSDGKEFSQLFKIPCPTNHKTLSTLQIAAIYYDQTSITNDLNIECISLLNENEFEQKIEEFNEKNILSICTSSIIILFYFTHSSLTFILESTAYIIYTKNLTVDKKYKLIRSTIVSHENLQWLHPFIDYSKQGYRLCGLIPFNQSSSENFLTIYWLFESNETISYDYCLLEYQSKSFSLNNWISLLNLMSKQEWKLVGTMNYNQKKKNDEHIYFLLCFQRLKH